MQISSIQTYNTAKPLNKNLNFCASAGLNSTSGIDMFTIKALTDKKIKSAYERFAKFYTKRKQEYIQKAFSTCINSDGTLSKYALYTLNALYNGQYPESWKNFKQIFKKEKIYGFSSDKKQSGNTLDILANIIASCKDNNNNQNDNNLKFAQELFLKTDTERKKIPVIINALKNNDGVCTEENIELFNILKENYTTIRLPLLLECMLNRDNIITDSAKSFVLQLNGGDRFNFSQRDYIFDVLRNTKNVKNRDEILDFISNSDYMKTNIPAIAYYRDCEGNINLDYLKKYLEINQNADEKDGLYVPAYIYQSTDETITDENIQQLKRLTNKGYNNDRIESFTKSHYFKKDEVINKEFIDYIINRVEYMFKNPDRYLADYYLDSSIYNAKEKNGNRNWDIAEMLHNFAYKFSKNANTIFQDKIKNMQKQLSELCKDENGNFTKENITETKKEIKYLINNFTNNTSLYKAEDYLGEKYLTHIIGDNNIYNPDEMLKILDKLDLNYKLMYTKIPEYENLLFAISEIPPEINHETYKKILEKIDGIRGLDFNVKDSHGISFLEKVLNSENKALLKLITHPSKIKLIYTPELDLVYNNIQDKSFKRLVDNELNLSFPLLEEAVRLDSKEAFEKIEHQLDSPLCKRKEVLKHLWELVTERKNKEFSNYFVNKFSNDLKDIKK